MTAVGDARKRATEATTAPRCPVCGNACQPDPGVIERARAEGREEWLSVVASTGLITTCREWLSERADRCNQPAEFILWGKLFDPEQLGPRCYGHAIDHTHHSMPSRSDQWAVIDLRPLRAAAQAGEVRRDG